VKWPTNWWPWHRAEDTRTEARHHLRRLEARDPEVERLGAELRETQHRNNFSRMVDLAIHRTQNGS
jgi:hypothetical protein